MNPSNDRNRKLRIKAKKNNKIDYTCKKFFGEKSHSEKDDLLIAIIQKERKKIHNIRKEKLEITLEGREKRENNVSDFIINNLKPRCNGNLQKKARMIITTSN